MNESLIIQERPTLREPRLIVGFSGWLDGGEASTGTVQYLITKLQAKAFAEIASRDFYVFQVPGIASMRPQVKLEDGLVKEIRFPQNEFFYWKNEEDTGAGDLILLLGTEPNLRWQEYTDAILDIAQQFGVKRMYSVGAVLGGVPHTKEPTVSCSISDLKLRTELERYAVRFSGYEGPATFNSMLVAAFARRGIEAMHMTGRAIYYPEFNIAIPHDPKAIYSLLRRLRRLLRISLDLSDLEKQCQELEEKLNFMVSQSPRLRDYVQELEGSFEEMRYEEPIEGSPEEFVKGVEEFLRQRRKEEER